MMTWRQEDAMTHFHKFNRLHEICFMFLYSNVYTVVRDSKYMQPRGTRVHCDYLSFTIKKKMVSKTNHLILYINYNHLYFLKDRLCNID